MHTLSHMYHDKGSGADDFAGSLPAPCAHQLKAPASTGFIGLSDTDADTHIHHNDSHAVISLPGILLRLR